MRFKARHRRWIGWLAWFAIWLGIVAPVVSRTLPGVAASAADSAACAIHAAMAGHAGAHGHPHGGEALDCCGYCVLLGHTPVLTTPFSALALAAPASLAPAAPWSPPALLDARRLVPPPRGPPLPLRIDRS